VPISNPASRARCTSAPPTQAIDPTDCRDVRSLTRARRPEFAVTQL
jgi:hypothetical protein